jgi:site-specific recombinase XerD
MIPNSDKLSAYLDYFFNRYLPQHRAVSPHTRLNYKQAFIQLLRFWQRRFPACPNPDLDRFQVEFLLDFLSHLEKELKNTASTRNTRLAALKSFFKMVALLQPRYQSQCRQILMIPLKRSSRWPLDYLDKKEVDAIFAGIDTQTQDGYRDLCILRTLYNTGARASELCALRIGDVDFHQKQVLLYGKGRKARMVPLWDSTLAFLRTYLKSERRRPRPSDGDFLFVNQRRTHLTRSGLYALSKHYLQQARSKTPSLEHKKLHPVHVWRYTTASHLLLAGVDITVIQEWLGHVSINTTCRYKGIPVNVKREALQKFYLFDQSSPQAVAAGIDWSLYPDLLAYLESL